MKEYKLSNGNTIMYKSSLTEDEYLTIVTQAFDAYEHGIGDVTDDLVGLTNNPIKAEQMFFRALLSFCIQDYKVEDYATYFQEGIPMLLLSEVVNAKSAWDLLQRLITQSLSVGNLLGGLLDILDSKLPAGDDMIKTLDKLPKNMKKALDGYSSIMSVSKKEFDAKEQNGDYDNLK